MKKKHFEALEFNVENDFGRSPSPQPTTCQAPTLSPIPSYPIHSTYSTHNQVSYSTQTQDSIFYHIEKLMQSGSQAILAGK